MMEAGEFEADCIYTEAVAMMEAGEFEADCIYTHVFSLDDVQVVYNEMMDFMLEMLDFIL